jgi:thioredoxin-like negative regulator of GroEL
MRMWRPALAVYAAVILGLALYAYEPLASATNPPINWGYARTPAGFVRHVVAGQYDKVHSERTPLQFWGQINMFFDDLKSQFTIVYALIALLALFFYRDLAREDRHWLTFLLVAFLFLGLDFIFFSNPTFEKQKQFTERVSFLPCHCLYSLWIGYGLILGCGHILTEKLALRRAAVPMAAVIFALPIAPLIINWADNEERGHVFGYQFGYLTFKPGGGYPDMDNGAILFGGTDQGRFLPTYMVYVESQVPPRARTRLAKYLASGAFDRRDVYVITQNALAEGMYMNSIRDHYGIGRPDPERPETLKARSRWQRALVDFTWRHRGRDQAYPKDPIWIPAESDQQTAIRQYLDELRMRQPLPGEDVRVENGRVNLRGVTSVMTVNGYVAKAIFDHNKGAHTFYVEESYVIPWMYPYLEPYGIIFKINKNPLPRLTPEMVARDRAYWDALFEELRGDPRFRRDDVAQKTFSKLRSSIGGLYAFRRMSTDAEYAFQQAIALCPDSPEGNFRLAQLYVESGRFDDAVAVLAEYQKHDRYNARIRTVINTIQKLKLQSAEQRELEQQYAAQPGNIQIAQQLLDSYAAHQRVDAMDAIVSALLSHTELPAETFLQIAQRYMAVGRLDRAAELLTAMVQRYPQSREAWYNLAVVESAQRNCDETLAALERALSLDDAEHRALQSTRRDPRLDTCRQDPRFQQLLTQPARRPPPSPLLPGDVTITH